MTGESSATSDFEYVVGVVLIALLTIALICIAFAPEIDPHDHG